MRIWKERKKHAIKTAYARGNLRYLHSPGRHASRHLGEYRSLAQNGVDVTINGRDEAALAATTNEIASATGVQVTPVCADISTPEGQAALLAAWLGGRAFPFSIIGAAGLIAGWCVVCITQFTMSQVWLNVLFPSLAIVVSFTTFSTLRVLDEQRGRRAIERQRLNLSRYFSPRVVDQLANRETPFATDRSQTAAVLFVDIVGSTRICERLTPNATSSTRMPLPESG